MSDSAAKSRHTAKENSAASSSRAATPRQGPALDTASRQTAEEQTAASRKTTGYLAPPIEEVLAAASQHEPAHEYSHSDSADGERLQKLIARAGVSSRRAAEEMIEQGRVSVNGHIVRELGAKADPLRDRIVVDGQPLRTPTGPATVLLLHKPTGVVTTKKDPEGRTTITHLLPDKYKHLHPIGRLDFDTAGVLLLTDDGSLTQLLTHPSHGVEKTYWARVRGHVSVPTLKKLEEGIYLEDGKTAPCKARVRAQTENNALVQLTLHEGRNRQVRRMLDAVGHPVRALRRVRFAGLGLEGMLAGTYRVLLPGEVHALRKAAEAKPAKAKSPRKPSRQENPSTSRAANRNDKPRTEGKPPSSPNRRPASSAGSQPPRPQTQSGRTPRSTQQRDTQHPVARRVEKKFQI
jgi:23S rRNA pseudouridine2605 synthase